MIDMNIKYLRKKAGLSQEELAEELKVTRQSVAKWERGESLPDIMKCQEIALLFNISIDSLVNFALEDPKLQKEISGGKYLFGIVKVGERGQIVIPKGARDTFNISPGDRLIVLGDKNKGGIALAKIEGVDGFASFE